MESNTNTNDEYCKWWITLCSYRFQEFMILPVAAPSFKEVDVGMKSPFTTTSWNGLTTAVGDEGGSAPEFDGTEDETI